MQNELVDATWLWQLLDEYFEKTDINDEARRNKGTIIEKSQVMKKKINRSIVEHLNPQVTGSSSHSLLQKAKKWWEERKIDDMVPEQQLIYLISFLDYINWAFSTRTPWMLGAKNGYLILGARWWGLQNPNCINRFTLYEMPFPYMRRIPKKRLEKGYWINDNYSYMKNKLISDTKGQNSEPALKIGLCAFSGNAKTIFKGTRILNSDRSPELGDRCHGFEAESIKWEGDPSGSYEKELRECIDWARDQDLHVLLMPELSVCQQKGLDILKKEIQEDPGKLCIVIPGSFHGSKNGAQYNMAPIWIIGQGVGEDRIKESAPAYTKAMPMQLKIHKVQIMEQARHVYSCCKKHGCGYALEDIVGGGSFRLVFTPVGIMGIMICRDFLFEDQFISKYKEAVDHLLVISMNSKGDHFKPRAQIASDKPIGVYYVNAMQVIPQDDTKTEVAFWALPTHSKQRSCYFRQDSPAPRKSWKTKLMSSSKGCVPVDPILINRREYIFSCGVEI